MRIANVKAAVLVSVLASSPAVAEGQDTQAELLLRKAEEMVVKHRHKAAVRTYKKLAKRHPDTEAGRIGKQRSQPTAYLGWADVLRHGPSKNRLDVAIMGDGYRLREQGAFDVIAEDLPKLFKRHALLGEFFRYHNFIRVNLMSKDAYVDAFGREYDTALNGHASDGLHGQVAVDRDAVLEHLKNVPQHDGLVIVYVQRGSLGTGGGGIATIGGLDDTTTIHEWGHALAGLGDEYARDVGYRGPVRVAANVSNTDDPEQVPWKHWLDARARGIGVYEGADGRVRGAWKPSHMCAMICGEIFCRVCREQIVLSIYRYVDPIDSCTPVAHHLAANKDPLPLTGVGPREFEVRVMRPRKHRIAVTWWVVPADKVPNPPSPRPGARDFRDRRARGPLEPIGAKPAKSSRGNSRGHHKFKLKVGDLRAGLYRVICRATDPTRIPGDKSPWVLRDQHGLLQSERGWWVVVDEGTD